MSLIAELNTASPLEAVKTITYSRILGSALGCNNILLMSSKLKFLVGLAF